MCLEGNIAVVKEGSLPEALLLQHGAAAVVNKPVRFRPELAFRYAGTVRSRKSWLSVRDGIRNYLIRSA
jgi:hypothetical protein